MTSACSWGSASTAIPRALWMLKPTASAAEPIVMDWFVHPSPSRNQNRSPNPSPSRNQNRSPNPPRSPKQRRNRSPNQSQRPNRRLLKTSRKTSPSRNQNQRLSRLLPKPSQSPSLPLSLRRSRCGWSRPAAGCRPGPAQHHRRPSRRPPAHRRPRDQRRGPPPSRRPPSRPRPSRPRQPAPARRCPVRASPFLRLPVARPHPLRASPFPRLPVGEDGVRPPVPDGALALPSGQPAVLGARARARQAGPRHR